MIPQAGGPDRQHRPAATRPPAPIATAPNAIPAGQASTARPAVTNTSPSASPRRPSDSTTNAAPSQARNAAAIN